MNNELAKFNENLRTMGINFKKRPSPHVNSAIGKFYEIICNSNEI